MGHLLVADFCVRLSVCLSVCMVSCPQTKQSLYYWTFRNDFWYFIRVKWFIFPMTKHKTEKQPQWRLEKNWAYICKSKHQWYNCDVCMQKCNKYSLLFITTFITINNLFLLFLFCSINCLSLLQLQNTWRILKLLPL